MEWTIEKITELTATFRRYALGREKEIEPLEKALANKDVKMWLAVARGIYAFDHPGITHDVFGEGPVISYHLNGKIKRKFSRKKYPPDGPKGLRRLHGKYRSYYDNGQLFEACTFKYGILHGLLRIYSREGKRVFKATYKNGFEQEPKK